MAIKITDQDGVEVTITKMSDSVAQDTTARIGDDGTVFFQRQLEAIEASTYDILYADLEARQVFPTNSFGGAGAQFLTYRSFDRVGSAKVINARGVDLPKSDISGFETTLKVKSIGCAYDFDIDEIAAAKMAGLPLEARKAAAARRGYEQLIESVTWFGDTVNNFTGFFSVGNGVPRANVPATGTGSSTLWSTKTPDQILADLNLAVSNMVATTLKVHTPSVMLLPVAQYLYIKQTARSSVSDTTILEFFLANNGYIKDIRPINALDAAGTAGADVIVVLCMTSPEGQQTVRIREPLPLQFLAVQLHGMVYEVPARGRFAGLEITYPSAMAIYEGI